MTNPFYLPILYMRYDRASTRTLSSPPSLLTARADIVNVLVSSDEELRFISRIHLVSKTHYKSVNTKHHEFLLSSDDTSTKVTVLSLTYVLTNLNDYLTISNFWIWYKVHIIQTLEFE